MKILMLLILYIIALDNLLLLFKEIYMHTPPTESSLIRKYFFIHLLTN